MNKDTQSRYRKETFMLRIRFVAVASLAVAVSSSFLLSSVAQAGGKTSKTKLKYMAAVGSVTGTLSWPKGVIYWPSSKVAAQGLKSSPLQDQINLHANTVNVTPGSAGSFGNTQRPRVGSEPTWGRVSVVGNVASVQYTITDLPTGVMIEIDAKPKNGGTFTHSGAPNFTCTPEAPAVSHWDLQFTAALH